MDDFDWSGFDWSNLGGGGDDYSWLPNWFTNGEGSGEGIDYEGYASGPGMEQTGGPGGGNGINYEGYGIGGPGAGQMGGPGGASTGGPAGGGVNYGTYGSSGGTQTGGPGGGSPAGGGGSSGGAGTLQSIVRGLTGGSGGLESLLPLFATILGGGMAYNASQRGNEAIQAGLTNANNIAQGAATTNAGLYKPYMDAGARGLERMEAFPQSDMASRFGPVGERSNMAAQFNRGAPPVSDMAGQFRQQAPAQSNLAANFSPLDIQKYLTLGRMARGG